MDKFPEAYRRFEQAVNTKGVKEFAQIELMFSGWAGKKWRPTQKQSLALAREADKRNIKNVTVTEWVVKSKHRRLTASARWNRRAIIGSGAPARKARRAQKSTNKRAIKIAVIKDYVDKKYSANKIQKELKKEKMGMRRKELLKIIRQYKNNPLKKDSNKHIRKKYRKKS